jgi:hypothetical protein
VFYEALLSDKAGSLHMIRDLLEGINPREVKQILQEMHQDLSRASKKYWLERGLKHAFPNTKLSELGLVRLNALKYKIVGETHHYFTDIIRLQVDSISLWCWSLFLR